MTERDPLQELWQEFRTNKEEETFKMTTADIRLKAGAFQSKIRTRNRVEYAASALVIGMFAWMAWLVPPVLAKAGAVLVVLGAVYVAWQLHRRAGAAAKAGIDRAASLTAFHRAELVRQREALSTVWRWYLLPFVPGIALFLAGVSFAADNPAPMAVKLVSFGFSAGICAAVFGGVWWLNAKAVKALDAEIEALGE
ncbi:hypothetical protein [Hyphomonas sp.]|uniref:hypothetical protein n=1 Tax=Hyphomonas sp. TaxID=87 RepID=UPI00391A8B4F